MAVTRWLVRFDGKEWGADGKTIRPQSLAEFVAKHSGEQRMTYYRKPYTLDSNDPQSVYDYFDSDIDPQGLRVSVVWEVTPDPQEWSIKA